MTTDTVFEQALARHWASASDSGQDAAHDLAHIRRVVRAAREIGAAEGANPDILIPAAWFHDLANLPKNHPGRADASKRSAAEARVLLMSLKYPAIHFDAICHAIEAHSFSANITPRTIEAECLQDADRLDALGAIGIARTFAVGGALGRPLFNTDDPFAENRAPDDSSNSLDHFYAKLLKLPSLMRTASGRAMAQDRAAYMQSFLDQLAREI